LPTRAARRSFYGPTGQKNKAQGLPHCHLHRCACSLSRPLPRRGSRRVARHFRAGLGYLKKNPSRRDGRKAWTPGGRLRGPPRRMTVSAPGSVAATPSPRPDETQPLFQAHPARKCRATRRLPLRGKGRLNHLEKGCNSPTGVSLVTLARSVIGRTSFRHRHRGFDR
jgi:hypothetical protein